jgi:hypothetical protein
VLAQFPSDALLATSDLSYIKCQCQWACVWIHLRLTDKTRVDPEFGAKLTAKLKGNLRITLIFGDFPIMLMFDWSNGRRAAMLLLQCLISKCIAFFPPADFISVFFKLFQYLHWIKLCLRKWEELYLKFCPQRYCQSLSIGDRKVWSANNMYSLFWTAEVVTHMFKQDSSNKSNTLAERNPSFREEWIE